LWNDNSLLQVAETCALTGADRQLPTFSMAPRGRRRRSTLWRRAPLSRKREWREALEHFELAEKLYWVQRPELMADATLVEGISQCNLGDCRAATTTRESIEQNRSEDADLNYVLGVCALDGHRDDLAKGVREGTPWLERARTYLRRAHTAGKRIDPTMAHSLRL
jgi:hypothetical protein